MLAKVTDLAQYRARVRPAVSDACAWHAAAESVMLSNLLIADATTKAVIRIWGATYRCMLRDLWRV